jgi:hypothetical protein
LSVLWADSLTASVGAGPDLHAFDFHPYQGELYI